MLAQVNDFDFFIMSKCLLPSPVLFLRLFLSSFYPFCALKSDCQQSSVSCYNHQQGGGSVKTIQPRDPLSRPHSCHLTKGLTTTCTLPVIHCFLCACNPPAHQPVDQELPLRMRLQMKAFLILTPCHYFLKHILLLHLPNSQVAVPP